MLGLIEIQRKQISYKMHRVMLQVALCSVTAALVIVSNECSTFAAIDCVQVVYEGKGAGQVVFDGSLHLSKGLACADCHEAQSMSFALFEMKRDASAVTMRRMEKGRSCGACHKVAMDNTINCEYCHKK